jgi:hypothetical protein
MWCHGRCMIANYEGKSGSISGTDRLSAVASSVAAPAIIIGAATVYFTGTVYRDKLFANFGFSGTALQESLQATMASGYLARLGMLVFFVPGFVSGTASRYFAFSQASLELENSSFFQRHFLFFRNISLIASLLMFAGAGWYSGMTAADRRYDRIITDVSGGCQRCFLYNTTRGRVVAVPLGQDANVVILVTRRGTVVLPTNSIRAVRPINRKPASAPGTFAFH